MLKWIKDKLGITALEEENKKLKFEIAKHKSFVNRRMDTLKDFIRVDADMGFRGNNTIIVTGLYKKQPYVKFYDVGDGEFERLVTMLNEMKDYSIIRHIDKPPHTPQGLFQL